MTGNGPYMGIGGIRNRSGRARNVSPLPSGAPFAGLEFSYNPTAG